MSQIFKNLLTPYKYMVNFGTDYWHSMDKKPLEKLDISTKELGLSAGIGDPLAQLRAHLTAGANHVEIGFMGVGHGSVNQPNAWTPSIVGKEKREEIRRLAKLNDVTLSTHASANLSGFSGFREGKFNPQHAHLMLTEAKKAVDFAADTAEGGPVVIHVAEFPRSTADFEKTWLPEKGKIEFYEGEAQKGAIYLVNEETGEVTASFTKELQVPDVERDAQGRPKVDDNGNFKFRTYNFEEFLNNNPDYVKKIQEDQGFKTEGEAFYHVYLEKQKERAAAEMGRYREQYEDLTKRKKDTDQVLNQIRNIAKDNQHLAEYQAIKLAREIGIAPSQSSSEYLELLEKPMEFLDKVETKLKQNLEAVEQGYLSQGKEIAKIEDQQKRIVPIRKFGTEKAAENMAKLALYAYDVEKERGLKKPMFIAPENLSPEMYGAHPQELKEMIMKTREQMVNELTNKNGHYKLSEKEAKKIAEEHVKATFDISHANTWRKYFEKRPDETFAESEKRFNKWLMGQIEPLVKEGIIGHAHLSDNFGQDDEHLTVGQGNTPVQEFVDMLKKHGVTDHFILEPGGQAEDEGGIYNAMRSGWQQLASSPIYRTGVASTTWSDSQNSYFARTSSPAFLTGQYLPSKEWGWWSETPLE